jgi:hypothetical protein
VMKTYRSSGFTAWLLLGLTVLGAACQRLDSNLASGSLSGPGGAGGVVTMTTIDPGQDGNAGTGGGDATGSSCATLRMQAYAILQTNCSICHEAPGTPALYQGSFTFILDLASLTSKASPQSSTTLTLKYVVKGSPGDSYIYQRISNGSMPPASRTQRPAAADMAVLNQWITSCIDDPTSPQGWSGSATPVDAGVDAGPALEACGAANVCAEGGCCVFNQCRPNGATCGALPNPIPGQSNLPGLPGLCTSGSCQTTTGASCGKVGEPCCDFQSCTASQSSCLTTDMSMCSACGGTGQPCCKPTTCLEGRACVGGGVGRVGSCQLCGALGQPCCGSGGAARQTCDAALFCVTDAVTGTRCSASADAGAGPDAP